MRIREVFASSRIKPKPPAVVLRYEQKGPADFDVHVYNKTPIGEIYLHTVPIRAVPAGSYETDLSVADS